MEWVHLSLSITNLATFSECYPRSLPGFSYSGATAKCDIEVAPKNPKLGENKKGDLNGVFVYKFKVNRQEMLLAYEWTVKQRLLLALGTHENFYRDLKKNI